MPRAGASSPHSQRHTLTVCARTPQPRLRARPSRAAKYGAVRARRSADQPFTTLFPAFQHCVPRLVGRRRQGYGEVLWDRPLSVDADRATGRFSGTDLWGPTFGARRLSNRATGRFSGTDLWGTTLRGERPYAGTTLRTSVDADGAAGGSLGTTLRGVPWERPYAVRSTDAQPASETSARRSGTTTTCWYASARVVSPRIWITE